MQLLKQTNKQTINQKNKQKHQLEINQRAQSARETVEAIISEECRYLCARRRRE